MYLCYNLHFPSKLLFSAKCSFFGQFLTRVDYQPTYQLPEEVYLLINFGEIIRLLLIP